MLIHVCKRPSRDTICMHVLFLLCKLALTCELHLFKDFHELLAFLLKSEFCLLFLLLLLKQSFVCGFLVCYSEHNVLNENSIHSTSYIFVQEYIVLCDTESTICSSTGLISIGYCKHAYMQVSHKATN